MNCQSAGSSYNGLNTIENATINYRIDRILLGKKLTKKKFKNIYKYEVVYNNIDCFTNDHLCDINFKTMNYKATPANYKINTNNLTININFGCSMSHTDNIFKIIRNSNVSFESVKKNNVNQVLKNIYVFRNFLVLILKKGIIVEKQYVYYENEKYQIFDCGNHDVFKETGELEDHLNHRCLKAENIKNLTDIYVKFNDSYDKLLPLIELYFNVTQFKVPNLIRFVNATTMLEYCYRTFDYNSALRLTASKDTKKVGDANFVDMIYSLIQNVNNVYNYTQSEIEQVSDNIKNARVHYIHYKNKTNTKILNNDEQFYYSYFIQDIVLLNIYKFLGFDINGLDYINFLEFYYDKNDLL